MKTCSRCKFDKPTSEFNTQKGAADGLYPHCKSCHAISVKEWQEANPFAYKTSRMCHQAKRRAKNKQLPFNLDTEWVREKCKGVCEVTGLPFDMSGPTGQSQANIYAPTIDRIVPSKGYVKSNCRMVIWGYNVAKFDFTDDQVFEWVNAWLVGLEELRSKGIQAKARE